MTQPALADLTSLRGSTAVVTGAGRGIGSAIAERLAEAGAAVLVVDVSLENAQSVAEAIERAGGKARAHAADVSVIAEADRAMAAAVEAFGGVDILVNNAGVFPPSTVMDLTEEVWDRTVDINLKGLFFWSRAAARQMAAAGRGGRIINITSVNATLPNLNLPHYAATKGGVSAATRALAQEFGRYGIRVNSVAPGGVNTPGGREVAGEVMKALDLKASEMPPPRSVLGRGGEADDIALAVYFLACGLSDYITGSNIPVDGGFLLI